MIGKYKVGDIVQVKQWNDMVKEFGLDEDGDIKIKRALYYTEDIYNYFYQEMKSLCGQKIKITGINKEDDGYFCENDKDFTWCDEMFENKNKNKEQPFITKLTYFDKEENKTQEIIYELTPMKEAQVEEGLDGQMEIYDWRKFKVVTEDAVEWIWDEILVQTFNNDYTLTRKNINKSLQLFRNYLINNCGFTIVDELPDKIWEDDEDED